MSASGDDLVLRDVDASVDDPVEPILTYSRLLLERVIAAARERAPDG